MRIVILTGAGISAESGLGTFRDRDGLWARFDPQRLATPEAFARDPRLVHEFYNLRRAACLDARPNAAHEALARLEKCKPGEVVLITQNVDDLHERAGSKRVIHMHGELARALCARCGARWPAPREMRAQDPCPACGAAATRPGIVWFGEVPHRMDEVREALAGAELFVAIGTSGAVWPAAGFVETAARAGARRLELNLEPSGRAGLFDESRAGPATRTVPAWVEEMLG